MDEHTVLLGDVHLRSDRPRRYISRWHQPLLNRSLATLTEPICCETLRHSADLIPRLLGCGCTIARMLPTRQWTKVFLTCAGKTVFDLLIELLMQ